MNDDRQDPNVPSGLRRLATAVSGETLVAVACRLARIQLAACQSEPVEDHEVVGAVIAAAQWSLQRAGLPCLSERDVRVISASGPVVPLVAVRLAACSAARPIEIRLKAEPEAEPAIELPDRRAHTIARCRALLQLLDRNGPRAKGS